MADKVPPTLQNARALKVADPANVDAVAKAGNAKVGQQLATFASRANGPNPNQPPNRFEKAILKRSQNAFIGGTDEDFLRDASNGRFDFSKELKLSIRHEYFTLKQYAGGVQLGLSVGLMVGMAIVVGLVGVQFDLPATYQRTLGAFFLAFAFGLWWGSHYARRMPRCANTGPASKYVDKERRYGQGIECISNADCTATTVIRAGMCRIPPRTGHIWWGRTFGLFIALVTGATMLGISFTNDGPFPTTNELVVFTLWGLSGGFIFAYIMS